MTCAPFRRGKRKEPRVFLSTFLKGGQHTLRSKTLIERHSWRWEDQGACSCFESVGLGSVSGKSTGILCLDSGVCGPSSAAAFFSGHTLCQGADIVWGSFSEWVVGWLPPCCSLPKAYLVFTRASGFDPQPFYIILDDVMLSKQTLSTSGCFKLDGVMCFLFSFLVEYVFFVQKGFVSFVYLKSWSIWLHSTRCFPTELIRYIWSSRFFHWKSLPKAPTRCFRLGWSVSLQVKPARERCPLPTHMNPININKLLFVFPFSGGFWVVFRFQGSKRGLWMVAQSDWKGLLRRSPEICLLLIAARLDAEQLEPFRHAFLGIDIVRETQWVLNSCEKGGTQVQCGCGIPFLWVLFEVMVGGAGVLWFADSFGCCFKFASLVGAWQTAKQCCFTASIADLHRTWCKSNTSKEGNGSLSVDESLAWWDPGWCQVIPTWSKPTPFLPKTWTRLSMSGLLSGWTAVFELLTRSRHHATGFDCMEMEKWKTCMISTWCHLVFPKTRGLLVQEL